MVVGGAVATVLVLGGVWLTGSDPPTGLEGALATIAGALLAAFGRNGDDGERTFPRAHRRRAAGAVVLVPLTLAVLTAAACTGTVALGPGDVVTVEERVEAGEVTARVTTTTERGWVELDGRLWAAPDASPNVVSDSASLIGLSVQPIGSADGPPSVDLAYRSRRTSSVPVINEAAGEGVPDAEVGTLIDIDEGTRLEDAIRVGQYKPFMYGETEEVEEAEELPRE